MMRLSGSVKFFCALGSGSSEGGAAGLLLTNLGLSLFLGLGLRSGLGGGRLRLSLQFACAARIFSARSLFCRRTPIRHLLGACRGQRPRLPRLQRPRPRSSFRHPGLELRRPLGHALVAHRLVFGGVRLDLRAVERHMASFANPPVRIASEPAPTGRRAPSGRACRSRRRCENPADQAL